MSRTYRKSKWDRLSREEYEKRQRHRYHNILASRLKWDDIDFGKLADDYVKDDLHLYDEKNRDWYDPWNWQRDKGYNYKAFRKEVKPRIHCANKRLCKKVMHGHETNKPYPENVDFKYLLWIIS